MARPVVCDDELCPFSGAEGCGADGPTLDLDRELDKLMELFSTDEAISFPAFADPFEFGTAARSDSYDRTPGLANEASQTTVKRGLISERHIEPDEDGLQQLEMQCTTSNEESSLAESEDHPDKRSRAMFPLPRIMKNDIRRYYSRMFMNTINSGDFGTIQNFFNTFMPWPCKFVADQDISPALNVPRRIVADGPRLMAHYLLGCFVQYPDMVLTMHSCEIVTSRSQPGTRIVMDMSVRSTKIYDLEMADWVPQLAALDRAYQKARTAGQEQLCPAEPAPGTGVCAPCTDGSPVTPRAVNGQTKRPRGRPRNSQIKNSSLVPQSQVAMAGTVGSKRKKGPINSNHSSCAVGTATGGESGSIESSATISDTTSVDGGSVVSTRPGELMNSHIPTAFVQGLFQQAKPLPTPLKLLLRGSVTLYLDEQNLMQHVNLTMQQLNK